MCITFSQLCDKDVINCNDGAKLGNVTDIEIRTDDCRITAMIVKQCTSILKKAEDIKIPWDKIEKIGTDVIIVNFKTIFRAECCISKEPRKRFFLK